MSMPPMNSDKQDMEMEEGANAAGRPPGNYGYRVGKPSGYAPVPVTTQPGVQSNAGPVTGEWMSIPVGIPNCPPGLEYLTTVDQLLVKQKVELLEALVGFETNNKFAIKNALGQNVYFAVEDNDCCTRNFCGRERPFNMQVYDNFRNEVIHIYRPFKTCGCCIPSCLKTLEVSAPPGNLLGTVEEEWSLCRPSYRIRNQHGEVVLRIEGPLCQCSLRCENIDFHVLTTTGEKIGKISKQWTGLTREFLTDADTFGINFPLELDARMKAVLLGATFLIDIMYFEV